MFLGTRTETHMSGELHIGWGETDITPDRKVELEGQYYRRVSRGIHSRLKAVAWALENEDDQCIMVSLDIVGFDREFQQALQERLQGKLPFDPKKVFLNTIHTHSGPAITVFINWWETDPDALPVDEFRRMLLEKLEHVVLEAWNNRKAGGISHGLGSARIGHCRRVAYADGTAEMYGRTDRDDFIGMEGGEDSGVDLLFCFDASGKPTGVVVNVPCPSQIMEATYVVSSDYMGRLRERLKEHFGETFRVLCQIAPAGDQAPRDLTRADTVLDFWCEKGLDIVASRLMATITSTYDHLAGNIEYGATLKHSVQELQLPRRRVSDQEYHDALHTMEQLESGQSTKDAYREFCAEVHANEKCPNRPGPYDNKLHHFVLIRNEEAVVKRHEDQNNQSFHEAEVHLVRLGDAVFATNPFELYQEYGQRIRARSRARQTFMVQLCSGYAGYLPTPRAERLGGYGGLVINGQVGSDGGAMLVDETVRSIGKLFAKTKPESEG